MFAQVSAGPQLRFCTGCVALGCTQGEALPGRIHNKAHLTPLLAQEERTIKLVKNCF